MTDLTTNERRKTSHISNAKVQTWTKEEDEELYKCHCLVTHTSARIRERQFNMWRMRNPNCRPGFDKDTLYRHFLRISKDKTVRRKMSVEELYGVYDSPVGPRTKFKCRKVLYFWMSFH